MVGEAVKAEPWGDNKASREEISRDQTRRGSHPALDSQRSLCSRCLLFSAALPSRAAGEIAGLGQPCRRSPWQLGSHLRGLAIKKGGLISVTGLISVAHRGLITYLTGSYQPGNKAIIAVGDGGRDARLPPHRGLAEGMFPAAPLSPDPHPLSAPQPPRSLA